MFIEFETGLDVQVKMARVRKGARWSEDRERGEKSVESQAIFRA